MDPIDDAIAALDRLADGRFGERVAKRAAPALEHVARAQWESGQDPDGKPWKRTQDGRVALLPLTRRITVSAVGDAVVVTGPDELTYHATTRPALPQPGRIPDAWLEALDAATREELNQ